MNKNLRKAMISAICMLIVGVMSLTGVTYAWFTSSNAATVTGMTFDVISPTGGVQISDEYNTGWAYSLGLDASVDFAPVSTAPSTVTGGDLKFFMGEVNTAPSDGVVLGAEIATTPAGTGAYFAKDIFLKNDGPDAVSVTLAGTSIKVNTKADSTDNGAQNAVRLALVKHGTYLESASAAPHAATQGIVIYEPNADVHVDESTGAGQKPYFGIKKASVTETSKNWFNSTVSNTTYNEAISAVPGFDAASYIPAYGPDADKNIDLTITVPAGECYAVTVYIWLEGQDVDCVNKVGGTNLMAELHFTTVGGEESN